MNLEQQFAATIAAHTGIWQTAEVCGDIPHNNAGQLIRRFLQEGWIKHEKSTVGRSAKWSTVNVDALREVAAGKREIPRLRNPREPTVNVPDCTLPLAIVMGYPVRRRV